MSICAFCAFKGGNQLIVMCGAVAAGRLVVVNPPRVNVTTIGTSPAPANDAGRVKLMKSKPGFLTFGCTSTIPSPLMVVVPTVTVTSARVAFRNPVTSS